MAEKLETGALKGILQSTLSVSRELEALQKEHQTILSNLESSTASSSEYNSIDQKLKDLLLYILHRS